MTTTRYQDLPLIGKRLASVLARVVEGVDQVGHSEELRGRHGAGVDARRGALRLLPDAP